MTGHSEEDDFWRVAMSGDETALSDRHYDETDDESSRTGQQAPSLKTYLFPNGVTLEVSTLPETQGIFSPLGSQAWHASLLLASYLISRQDFIFENSLLPGNIITALELGSGAVGLSGLTLAAVLGKICPSANVLLTDLPEYGILTNLQDNVTRNQTAFPNVNVQVQPLNWMDYSASNTSVPHLPPLDLVVGSELVYTRETATACAAVVTRLLQDNPMLVVLIVQVMDRPGFKTHFLPLFQEQFHVRIDHPLNENLHDMASEIVASSAEVQHLAGSLDRSAYGACWIRQNANHLS